MASRMSKTWLIMVTLIIAVLTLVGGALSCGSSSPSDSTPSPTPQTDKAPDFTLSTMGGAQITLSELEGTPVVLNFWATWCGYCVPELPYFEAVAQNSEGLIKIIAIDVGEPISRVESFFSGYEPTMIVALDSNGKTFASYCQKYNNPRGAVPFTVLIDSDGIVKYTKLGAFTSETELRDSLDSIL